MLCAKFGWNWLNASGEEDEIVESLQTDVPMDQRGRTYEQTDERRSEKLTWAFSSGEQKSVKGFNLSLGTTLCDLDLDIALIQIAS